MNKLESTGKIEKNDLKGAVGKFSAIFETKQVPDYSEVIATDGPVTWGVDDNFPLYLYEIYEKCTTLQSALNSYVDFTVGDEIINNTDWTDENSVGDKLEDVIRKCAYDLWIFGGFAVEVNYNLFGTIHSINYLDVRYVRVNKDLTEIYVYPDMNRGDNYAHSHGEYLTFAPFGSLSEKDRIEKGSEIFFYRGTRTKNYYPIPDYFAALLSAEIQIEIKRYHFNNISNGMHSATIINFNDAENVTDEDKSEIEKQLKEKFTGASGAGEIMCGFNSDKDHEVTVQKLDDDNFDSKFQQLADNTREDLFISLRANPQLLGMAVTTGLQTQEFDELYNTTHRLVILPKQNELIRCFSKIFKNQIKNSDEDDENIDEVNTDENNNKIDAIEIKKYSLGIEAAPEGEEGEEAPEEDQEGEEKDDSDENNNDKNNYSNESRRFNNRRCNFKSNDDNRQKYKRGKFSRRFANDSGSRYRADFRHKIIGKNKRFGK